MLALRTHVVASSVNSHSVSCCSPQLWVDVYWLPSAAELAGAESSCDVQANFQRVNAVSSTLEMINPQTLKPVAGVTKWHAVLEVTGTFRQSLDLRSFPLDAQSLIVRIEMGNTKRMLYRPAAHQATCLSVEVANCPLAGWQWVGAAVSFTRTDPALSKQGNSYAQAVFQFKLARNWSPYVHRVALFTALMMISAALVFLMEPIEHFTERLSFLFTLQATVANHRAVNDRSLLSL